VRTGLKVPETEMVTRRYGVKGSFVNQRRVILLESRAKEFKGVASIEHSESEFAQLVFSSEASHSNKWLVTFLRPEARVS
jgi:hypothetical protein